MFSQAVVEVRAVMPEFFSQRRIRAMRDVFHEIDVDEGLNLDQEELAPFYEYVFYKLFDVNLTRDEQEQVKACMLTTLLTMMLVIMIITRILPMTVTNAHEVVYLVLGYQTTLIYAPLTFC
jgi:hypothetical protein